MADLILVPVFDDTILCKPLAGSPVWERTASFALSLGASVAISLPSDRVSAREQEHPRPVTLSGNEENLAKIAAHELNRINWAADNLIILSPRCPLRRREDYDKSLRELGRSWVQGTVTTVYDEPDTMVYLRSGARSLWHRNDFQRPLYRISPSIVSVKVSTFKETGSLIAGKCATVPIQKEYAVCIEDGWDILAAEAYLKEMQLVTHGL